MIIYGMMTQTNIGHLMAAGILPGIVAVFFYLLAVQYAVRVDPASGPPGARTPWPERLRLLSRVWGVTSLFLVVMVGIYGGFFTATEAAGIGAAGAFFFALFGGQLTWASLYKVLLESAVTTAMPPISSPPSSSVPSG